MVAGFDKIYYFYHMTLC